MDRHTQPGTGITGTHTTDGIPHGYTSLTPFIVVERAGDATVREPVTDFVSGDRFASIRDPFGVRWSVMSRVEDLSEAESAQRVAAWAAAGSGSVAG